MIDFIASRRIALIGSTAAIALIAGAATAQTAPGSTAGPEAVPTAAASPANAATAEPDEEAIVVTGFRASLAKSIEAKRNLDVVAEVITAEDIGRLPDVSIAESLARLPGVTSQRTGGQASAINIRGLSQDLVSATLNGREQVATSGNRVIEFDQYPSELINQAAVYKSPKASQIEGGIAGKVELSTARPLSLNETVVNVNVRGQYNDRAGQVPDADKYGYRASASIQTQLLDHTLGIALGYSRLQQANVATRFVGYDYTPTGQSGSPAATDRNGDGRPDSIGYGFEATQFGGTETRDGVIGSIQYEPDDSFRVLLDGYWSQFKSDVYRRGIRFENLQSSSGILTNPTIVNNSIVGGTVVGAPLTTRTVQQDERRKDKLYTFGGNIQKDVGRVTFALDASYSRGTSFFNNAGLNSSTVAFDASGAPTPLSLNYQLNGLSIGSFDTNFDYTNPAGNQFQGFYIVPQYDTDRLYAFAGSVTYRVDGSFVKSFEAGVRYANRRAERTITTYDGFNFAAPVTLDSSNSSIGGFKGRFSSYPDFLVADITKIFDQQLGKDRVVGQPAGQPFTQDQSFTIDEKTWAGYGQLNFDTIAGSLPFKGNIGLRVVHTDQSSGSSVAGAPPVNPDPSAPPPPPVRDPVVGGSKFTDFLPSANFILGLGENDQVRLSLSRQISRARFFDLRGSVSTNLVGTGNGTARIDGNGGNPTLKPYRANQVDMTFEHYMGRGGALVVGAFYKDIRSFVIGGVVPNYDFAAAGISPGPDSLSLYPNGITTTGNLFAPINGKGGYVYGFEAAFTKTFDFLPAPFDGLGVSANIAYNKSAVSFTSSLSGNSLSITLPGLSKVVSNPTVFYEKSGFGARVGMRYRSKFVAPQIGLNEQIVTNASETVFDAQLSYEFRDGPLRGLTILAQANNFTDEPTRSYFGQQAQTGTIQYFGRQYYLGASFKF